jgi:two-component system chemotaxis sensor kinase CheA
MGDDGRGIDIERIKQIAIEKGYLKQKPLYSTEEILNVLFEPGFSTAQKVSDISGRGVGLDVVKRKITEIRGEVTVNTIEGKGTTFTIKLPLTLSIIDGLMVEVNNDKYILPVNLIKKIYQVTKNELEKSFYNIIVLDNEQIPFISLRSEFKIENSKNEIQHAIVIGIDDKKFAIIVDKVLGEYQAVLKPLGKLFTKIQIFSGATILGDGSIALVVDLQKVTVN